jgi:uncharacterized protein YndB with AHSA1/START domain
MNKLSISERIHAAPAKVWDTMLGDATYRDWTTAFAEGSYFEGSWEQGKEIHFLSAGGGGGMAAVIAECRPHEFLSIKHVGVVTAGGDVDTESEEVKKWAPVFENYRFVAADGGGTEVQVEMDVTPDFECFMEETWPKALTRLKALCEAA